MPIVELPIIWTIIVDVLAWGLFHLGISTALFHMPSNWFAYDTAFTRIRRWERGGEIWQRLFGVKHWKDRLPDGGSIFIIAFQKKQLMESSTGYLRRFVIESRRAEWTHWLLIPPSFLFFLWNPPWVGWIMLLYALAVNVPFILIQRYNRPRLQRLSDRKITHKRDSARQTRDQLPH